MTANDLRAAVANKPALTTYYDIPKQTRPFIDAIVERLQEARQEATRAKSPGAPGTRAQREKRIAETEKKSAEVKAELDACFYRVEFRPLQDDATLDELVTAHPATDEQRAKAKKADPDATEADLDDMLDLDGFRVALLARCVVDSDLTEDEWRKLLWSPGWSRADRDAIFERVDQANRYEFNAGIPKD